MKRNFLWLVVLGGILAALAVLWQVFAIAAYFRTAESGWLDAHGLGSLFVHIGQLAIVIGAIVAAWGNWKTVGTAVAFLVLSVAQLGFLGDTENGGGGDWYNGLHGLLAIVVLLAALAYYQWAGRRLGLRWPGVGDSA